jgi:predicted AlkP superfamily phosphohydrolase/phosphomutase
MPVSRLLVIGIDGAPWSLLGPWMDQGYLPHLTALRENGASGPLLSTIQPLSAPAWVTFLTGTDPGKHGVYGFVRRKPGAYAVELTDSRSIQAPTLFEHLGKAGLRVVSINIPMTYPVWPINGFLVAGPFAPSVGPSITYPPSLWAEIEKNVPGYEILPDYKPRHPDPEAELAQDLVLAVRKRTAVARLLIERDDWDALFIVYTASDQVQHSFWHYLPAELAGFSAGTEPVRRSPHLGNPILDVYREIDAGIGALLDLTAEQAAVLVLSDHGAGPLEQFVHLNNWLAEHGYLAYKTPRPSIIQDLIALYARSLPQPARRRIRRLMGSRFTELKEVLETSALLRSVDWGRTRVYALGSGEIYVNLRGREPMGVVEPGAEYERLRNEVIEGLLKLEAPGGGPIVQGVFRREEIYAGPALESAPDLTLVPADHRFSPMARFSRSRSLFESSLVWRFDARPLTGGHSPEGILMTTHPSIPVATRIRDARLVDLAPTIMGMLSLSVPSLMDGRALFGGPCDVPVSREIPQTSPREISSASGDTYSADEEREIERRLGDLGYL